MSIQNMGRAVIPINNIKGLNPSLQVIYMWLCHHVNNDMEWATISALSKIDALVLETNITKHKLTLYLLVLEDLDLIVRTPNGWNIII